MDNPPVKSAGINAGPNFCSVVCACSLNTAPSTVYQWKIGENNDSLQKLDQHSSIQPRLTFIDENELFTRFKDSRSGIFSDLECKWLIEPFRKNLDFLCSNVPNTVECCVACVSDDVNHCLRRLVCSIMSENLSFCRINLLGEAVACLVSLSETLPQNAIPRSCCAISLSGASCVNVAFGVVTCRGVTVTFVASDVNSSILQCIMDANASTDTSTESDEFFYACRADLIQLSNSTFYPTAAINNLFNARLNLFMRWALHSSGHDANDIMDVFLFGLYSRLDVVSMVSASIFPTSAVHNCGDVDHSTNGAALLASSYQNCQANRYLTSTCLPFSLFLHLASNNSQILVNQGHVLPLKITVTLSNSLPSQCFGNIVIYKGFTAVDVDYAKKNDIELIYLANFPMIPTVASVDSGEFEGNDRSLMEVGHLMIDITIEIDQNMNSTLTFNNLTPLLEDGSSIMNWQTHVVENVLEMAPIIETIHPQPSKSCQFSSCFQKCVHCTDQDNADDIVCCMAANDNHCQSNSNTSCDPCKNWVSGLKQSFTDVTKRGKMAISKSQGVYSSNHRTLRSDFALPNGDLDFMENLLTAMQRNEVTYAAQHKEMIAFMVDADDNDMKEEDEKEEEDEDNDPVGKTLQNVPNEFIDPITLRIMKYPVVIASGHSYEQSSILRWFQTHKSDPRTGASLPHKIFLPNHQLRSLIEDFVRKREINNPEI